MGSEPWDGEDEDTVMRRRGGEQPAPATPEADDAEGDTRVSTHRAVPAVVPASLTDDSDGIEGDTVLGIRHRPDAAYDEAFADDTVISARRVRGDEVDDATAVSARRARRQRERDEVDDETHRRPQRSGVEVPDASEIRDMTEPMARSAGARPTPGHPSARPRVGRAEIPVDPSSPLGVDRYQVRRGDGPATPQRYRYGMPATRQRTSVPDPPPRAVEAAPRPRVRARVVALAVAGIVALASLIGWLVWF